jgi:proline dehydrogenase
VSTTSAYSGAFDRLVAGVVPYVPQPIVRRLAQPYVAGVTLDDAVRTVRELNSAGLQATVDVLGEAVTDAATASAAADAYIRAMDVIAKEALGATVSVKPSALGSALGWDIASSQIERVVRHAEALESFVCIDMEDSQSTDHTLTLFRKLRRDGHERVGTVLQARLWRAAADAAALAPLHPALRLCKGIYLEPSEAAMRDRDAIRLNFSRILRLLLNAGAFVAIATHDEELIVDALDAIDTTGTAPDGYEFQTLLGVRPDLARVLARDHTVRVYVPFGPDSYAYSQRRLRENPQIAGYVARDVLRTLARSLRRPPTQPPYGGTQ